MADGSEISSGNIEYALQLAAPDGGANPKYAFDLFTNGWGTQIVERALAEGGVTATEERPKELQLLAEYFPEYQNFVVLELEAREAEHTRLLDAMRIRHIYSIEPEPLNFLKCLVVKNHFMLNKVRFGLGSIFKYLEADGMRFDLVYWVDPPFANMSMTHVFGRVAQRGRRLILSTSEIRTKSAAAFSLRGRQLQPRAFSLNRSVVGIDILEALQQLPSRILYHGVVDEETSPRFIVVAEFE